MPKSSAEEKAAKLWRIGAKPPRPPPDLRGPARKLWISLAASRPPYFWTEAAKFLLRRLVLTAASTEIVHAELDRDPAGANSSRIARQVATLNASITSLSRQLRLNPINEIAPDARERLTERGSAIDDEEQLLGGPAVHGRP
jgi:hypothetical protein